MSDRTAPERWRVGRTLGRTLYIQVGEEPSKDDRCVGLLDTRELAEQVVAAVNARGIVQAALDGLDDLLDLDALSDEDLAAVDAWANNIQLDIMRHQRRQGGRRA